jgi:hypothetical protein
VSGLETRSGSGAASEQQNAGLQDDRANGRGGRPRKTNQEEGEQRMAGAHGEAGISDWNRRRKERCLREAGGGAAETENNTTKLCELLRLDQAADPQEDHKTSIKTNNKQM